MGYTIGVKGKRQIPRSRGMFQCKALVGFCLALFLVNTGEVLEIELPEVRETGKVIEVSSRVFVEEVPLVVPELDMDEGRAELAYLLSEGRVNEAEEVVVHYGFSFTASDAFLLAKVVTNEAGSSWLSAHHREMVASVVMNRVASPEFPDTLSEVVYSKGAYAGVSSQKFQDLLPYEYCVEAAMSVLENGSVCPASVVFQANFSQGKAYLIIPDKILATTYFCYSPNMSYYE